MSIPSKVLKAVAEPPKSAKGRKGVRARRAAGLVRDFARARALEGLDAVLTTAQEPCGAMVRALSKEALAISQETGRLGWDAARFLGTDAGESESAPQR